MNIYLVFLDFVNNLYPVTTNATKQSINDIINAMCIPYLVLLYN